MSRQPTHGAPPPAACCLQALLASPPPDPDASTRLDLTHLAVYTIDDATTRDVDDGISVEVAEDGQLLLWVHVADPTRWLQPGEQPVWRAHLVLVSV